MIVLAIQELVIYARLGAPFLACLTMVYNLSSFTGMSPSGRASGFGPDIRGVRIPPSQPKDELIRIGKMPILFYLQQTRTIRLLFFIGVSIWFIETP